MKEEYINNIPLFAELTSRGRRALTKKFNLEDYKRNEVVFEKESDGDALYIIESGSIGLSADGKTNLATLGPGSLLGEADFFQGTPHTVTARATTDVSVWVLDDNALTELIKNTPHIGLSLSQMMGLPVVQLADYLAEKLGEVSSMQTLSTAERKLMARQMTAATFETSEAVYHSNDPAAGLFLIEEGAVRLIGGANNDYIELGPGEVFGEMAVITGKRHAVTAQAAVDTVVWRLPTEDFAAIAKEQPQIRTALSRTVTSRLSAADQSHAAEVLAQVPLFSQLPPKALESSAAHLMLRHIPADQPIYRIGDPGDAMYIVESGEVEIRDKQGGLVFRPTEGDFFGDMALLTGKNRENTAIATQDCNLWAMYRSDFDTLLVKHPQLSIALSQSLQDRLNAADNQFVEKHLEKLAVLGGLSRMQLDEISAHLHARRLKQGDMVFQEGDQGEELYFIENGVIERTASTQGGIIALPSLTTGDFLGETALISGHPHATAARAQTDVDIWTLTKADFDELVYRYPNLSAVLNRIMSERLVETMSIMRNTPVQPSIPAQTGPAVVPPPPAQPYRTTGNIPPIPVRRVAPPSPPHSRPVSAAPAPQQVKAPKPAARSAKATSRPVAKSKRRVSTPVRTKSRTVRPSAASNVRRGAGKVGSGFQRKTDGLSKWFAGIPLGTRLGLFVLLLLLIWMCGIAAPAGIISALAATIFDTGVEQAADAPGNAITNGLSQNGLVAALPFVETVTPTPTNTGTPTTVPSASATVTQTPIPTYTPSPTYTPTPVDTATHTPTPLPTDTPTATPIPATNTSSAPRLPTDTPTPEATPTPDADFIVAKVRKLTPCENQGKHHIFVHVIDMNGQGLNNIPVKIAWGPNSADNVIAKTETKDNGPGYIEFAMFKGTYSVEVLGVKSQVASGITPDFQVDEPCKSSGNAVGNSLFHASFEVVLQRTF